MTRKYHYKTANHIKKSPSLFYSKEDRIHLKKGCLRCKRKLRLEFQWHAYKRLIRKNGLIKEMQALYCTGML